jgi:FMN reductase
VIPHLIAINGSPSPSSRTAALANAAVELNGAGTVIQLGELDASALLARRTTDDVNAALDAVRAADALVVVSPVYRRTYSGLLKAFFDLFEPAALTGMPAALAVTAGHGGESLCIDHGLRPLIASLEGWTVPTAVYATHADFTDGKPVRAVCEQLKQSLAEVASVAHAEAVA